MTSSLYIGGFPCRMTGPLVWTLYTGPQYRFASLPMDPDDADKILKSEGLVKIEYRGRGKKLVEFERVVVIGESPSPDPFTRIVEFADTRYFWPRIAYSRNFNETVSSPVARTFSPTGTPLALQQNVDDLKYAGYSINPDTGKPWEALDVLRAVLVDIVGEENADWEINNSIKNLPKALVQDIFMPGPSDNGVSAMAKALSLIPGSNCYQGYDGKIYIDSMLPGRATNVIESLGPPLDSGQDLRIINRARDRAKKVLVWSPMEVGARFDAIQTGDSVEDSDPWLKNIASTVEPSTTLSDGSTVGPGTAIEIGEAIDRFNDYLVTSSSIKDFVSTAGNELSRANILAKYTQGLENHYYRAGEANLEPDPVGGSICREIYNSLFLRYRMNPLWSENCIAIIPKQVGIIDPETGGEAEAAVYSDFAARPSFKNFNRSVIKRRQDFSVNNYNGVQPRWQSEVEGSLDRGTRGDGGTGARRSPARVGRVTRAGVFDISYRKDPLGFEAEIIPDTVDKDTIPSATYAQETATFNQARLEDSHRLNVVLTLVPAPVGRGKDGKFRHMTGFEVLPSEAAKKLGVKSVGDVLGIEVAEEMSFVQPAKFSYDDSLERLDDIKITFGLVDEGVASTLSGPFLMVTEPGPGTPINLKDLQEVALSIAASYYMERLDRYAGSKTVPLRGDLEPIGEISTISHVLMPSGKLMTTVSCAYDYNEILNPLALLPSSARRTLLRQVSQTGA